MRDPAITLYIPAFPVAREFLSIYLIGGRNSTV